MGPTATGKTDAAAAIAERLNGEIISVDSSLVYRGMNIGTAKPEPAFLARHPHHLVDIRAPQDTYSVAEFHRDCTALIDQIVARGKVPVLAGGTHFYFNALEQGLAELPAADSDLRDEISADAVSHGWAALHEKLAALDPASAQRIDPHDAQRIQRALEIVLLSGKPVAEHNVQKKAALSRPMLKIALVFSDRAELHARIEQRFDGMIEQGLQGEIEGLLNSGVAVDAPAMKMIGYRQMLEFLAGDATLDQARGKSIAATRQLAKRQLTWLRNQSNVLWWVDCGLKQKKFDQLLHYVQQFLR